MPKDKTPSQAPLPIGLSVLKPQPRRVSGESIEILQHLLTAAKEGRVSGLAIVTLHSDGRFDLGLHGDATIEPNQMGVVGMLAALQKMALELH